MTPTRFVRDVRRALPTRKAFSFVSSRMVCVGLLRNGSKQTSVSMCSGLRNVGSVVSMFPLSSCGRVCVRVSESFTANSLSHTSELSVFVFILPLATSRPVAPPKRHRKDNEEANGVGEADEFDVTQKAFPLRLLSALLPFLLGVFSVFRGGIFFSGGDDGVNGDDNDDDDGLFCPDDDEAAAEGKRIRKENMRNQGRGGGGEDDDDEEDDATRTKLRQC